MLEVSQNLIQVVESDVPSTVQQSSQIVQVIVDDPPTTVQNSTNVVQVLISTLPFATDTLEFTETAAIASDDGVVDETLNLVETVDGTLFTFVLQDPVAETLTFTETITAEVTREASDILDITESNSVDIEQESVISESLILNETAEASLEFFIDVSDDLTIGEPSGDLGTFDFETNSFIPEEIGLRDSATVSDLPQQNVSEVLNLFEDNRGWVISPGPVDPADDSLTFTEIARVAVENSGGDTLSFTENNVCEVSQDVTDVLDLTEVADSCLESSTTVEETLTIVEGFTVCHVQAFDRCGPHRQFAPQSGSQTLKPYADPQVTQGFRLQAPAGGPVVDELILVNPNLGNRDRISPVRVNVQSRGGSLIIFHDPIWPTTETKLYTFSNMKREMAHALLEWLCEKIGQEIRLIDHENRLWRGIITQPGDPIVEDRRGRYTGSFEFEGELVE